MTTSSCSYKHRTRLACTIWERQPLDHRGAAHGLFLRDTSTLCLKRFPVRLFFWVTHTPLRNSPLRPFPTRFLKEFHRKDRELGGTAVPPRGPPGPRELAPVARPGRRSELPWRRAFARRPRVDTTSPGGRGRGRRPASDAGVPNITRRTPGDAAAEAARTETAFGKVRRPRTGPRVFPLRPAAPRFHPTSAAALHARAPTVLLDAGLAPATQPLGRKLVCLLSLAAALEPRFSLRPAFGKRLPRYKAHWLRHPEVASSWDSAPWRFFLGGRGKLCPSSRPVLGGQGLGPGRLSAAPLAGSGLPRALPCGLHRSSKERALDWVCGDPACGACVSPWSSRADCPSRSCRGRDIPFSCPRGTAKGPPTRPKDGHIFWS
ncbi:uncharacterized protein [Callorhinus ursinus]|uniref:uncharacterized protein n=1 Tax=Callorhinus ursinus TaxID=34884 RepID=UPI003CCFF6CB